MTTPQAFRNAFAAFAFYALCAAVLLWHGAALTHQLSGVGSDPYDSVWFLAWWPYAVTHHLPLFFTRLIWYPSGVSTLWVTAVPLLALLSWPVQALGGVLTGPLLAYNLLIITAPPMAAWFAFLLCRYLTRDFTAALTGGYLFGFSSYEIAQCAGALNLSVIFCLPALLLLILLRLDERLGRAGFVALAALLLLAQFLICIETLAMMFVFGGIAWGLALAYMPERRAVLRRLFVDGLVTAPFVLVPLAPLLLSMARHYSLINHPALWPYFFTADLLSVVIPTKANLFGAPFLGLSKHFNGGPQEEGSYIGLPLLALLALYARGQGGTARGRFLVTMFLVCLVCSFGPRLWVAGHFSAIMLPWSLAVHLPLLGSALTIRFSLYAALVLAVITAYWVALPGRRGARLGLALLGCIALLPRPHPWMPDPRAAFFAPGRVQQILGAAPRLMIMPYSINGPSSYWQVENDFGFTEVGGYLGFPPAPAQKYQAVDDMFGNIMEPGFVPAFAKYARESGAQYVVAGPGANPNILAAISTLGWATRRVDDVTIITVPAP